MLILKKINQKEALSYYVKAAESNKNDFTTPRFLLKAGKTALALGQKEDALKYLTILKITSMQLQKQLLLMY